jgi:hypothetical protein
MPGGAIADGAIADGARPKDSGCREVATESHWDVASATGRHALWMSARCEVRTGALRKRSAGSGRQAMQADP